MALDLPRFVKVFTFVGLPPGLPAALFLVTALLISAAVILLAFDLGTHFGYLPLMVQAGLVRREGHPGGGGTQL